MKNLTLLEEAKADDFQLKLKQRFRLWSDFGPRLKQVLSQSSFSFRRVQRLPNQLRLNELILLFFQLKSQQTTVNTAADTSRFPHSDGQSTTTSATAATTTKRERQHGRSGLLWHVYAQSATQPEPLQVAHQLSKLLSESQRQSSQQHRRHHSILPEVGRGQLRHRLCQQRSPPLRLALQNQTLALPQLSP